MGLISIREAVYTVFQLLAKDYKELHIDDIALQISYNISEYNNKDVDWIKKQVSQYLANHTSKKVKNERVVKKGELYERVPNGKGKDKYKKGIYRLVRPPRQRGENTTTLPIQPTDNKDTDDKNYIGSAGEMAVCSELLFRDYNVSQMSVDDGVDVVAIKDSKTYYIQVKTVHVCKSGFSVNIKTKSFERYNHGRCFYIIVARTDKNIYIVLTADDIKRMITKGDIKKNEKIIILSFSQSNGNITIKSENIQYAINNFERIM